MKSQQLDSCHVKTSRDDVCVRACGQAGGLVRAHKIETHGDSGGGGWSPSAGILFLIAQASCY